MLNSLSVIKVKATVIAVVIAAVAIFQITIIEIVKIEIIFLTYLLKSSSFKNYLSHSIICQLKYLFFTVIASIALILILVLHLLAFPLIIS